MCWNHFSNTLKSRGLEIFFKMKTGIFPFLEFSMDLK